MPNLPSHDMLLDVSRSHKEVRLQYSHRKLNMVMCARLASKAELHLFSRLKSQIVRQSACGEPTR